MSKTLSRNDLINEIILKTDGTKADANRALTAITETITKAVANGDKVQLVGFGSFVRRDRKQRQGRNPQTGKPIKIPARQVPAFHAGLSFKKAVEDAK